MGLFSKFMGELADTALISLACATADIECMFSSLGIKSSRSSNNTSHSEFDNSFFAHSDLDQLKQHILPLAESIEAQLIEKQIAIYTSPFELWIPAHSLNLIKDVFREAIKGTQDKSFVSILTDQLNPNNADCQTVFSIPSDEERKEAIDAYQALIFERTCEQFINSCDTIIKPHLPKLLTIAEHSLAEKQSDLCQRDLERAKILVTRSKLTMIDDYLNLNP